MNWPTLHAPDATTRLAEASHAVRPAIDEPNAYTLCDRCRAVLGSGIYRLARGHIAGTPATWFICVDCDGELVSWWISAPGARPLGGTKPIGGL